MNLTFRYPVYPTQTQETTLLKWLEHLCELQNSARHHRKVAWETEGERVSCYEQQQKLTVARKKYDDFREVPQDMHQFCGTVLDRDHNAALNILLRAAAALRGERWVTTLYEARNKNEARDEGLQNATQLLLFDAMASPTL